MQMSRIILKAWVNKESNLMSNGTGCEIWYSYAV